jgi:hypothetical protein
MHVTSVRGCERSLCGRRSGSVGPRMGMGDASAVERHLGGVGPHVDAQNGEETDYSGVRPFRCPGASGAYI